MSYRSYRLMMNTEQRSSWDTDEVQVHIKNLKQRLEIDKFDKKDRIKILYLFTSFVKEADMLNMSEEQAFISLPTFPGRFCCDPVP